MGVSGLQDYETVIKGGSKHVFIPVSGKSKFVFHKCTSTKTNTTGNTQTA